MSRVLDSAGNLLEFVRQPLYDHINVVSTALEFRWFAIPRGQNNKTSFHSNLDQAGMLPTPKSMLIDGIRIVPTSKIVDAVAKDYMRAIMWDRTWFSFEVGGLKSYLTVPLWYLPAGVGMPGIIDQGGDTASTIQVQLSNGAPVHGNFFSIRTHPILLPSQQSFVAILHADASLSVVTTSTALWCVLEGVHGRETM